MLPSKPLPTIGEENTSADPKIRDVLQELQAILTSNVNRDNVKDGEITLSKAASDLLNRFLKLGTAGDRKIVWGSFDNGGASWGVAPDRDLSIPHGQGVAPQWYIVWGHTAASTASGTDPTVVCERAAPDATNLYVKQSTLLRGNCNFPGASVFWLGIF